MGFSKNEERKVNRSLRVCGSYNYTGIHIMP